MSADVSGHQVEPFVKADDVAERLGVSRAWVLQQARDGIIPHYRFGVRVKFRMSEVDAWTRTQRGGEG